MIKVVYRVIHVRNFRGKDAERKAKKFVRDTKKKPMTDDVIAYEVNSYGGTNGYFHSDKGKWEWEELG